MSLSAMVTPAIGSMASEGGTFTPPSPDQFWQPLWGSGVFAFTRPMLVLGIVTILLAAWLLWATAGAKAVPTKRQFIVEYAYNFVRNDIAKDMIGSHEFRRFVPFLFTLFMFILLNNLAGIIPPFQNPPMARIAFPIALVALVYIMFHAVGIKKHGLGGYFALLLPPGLPGWIKPVIFILEFVSNFIVRPLTLTLRLFGNMMAGHMVLVLFILGGEFLLFYGPGLLKAAGVASYVMAILMTFFEMLVQFLQAYVFTLLAASYIGGALADEH